MEHGVVERERIGEPGAEEALYGLSAEFERSEDLLEAARHARTAGYRRLDAYSPFAVEGLDEVLRKKDFWVPLIMLIGGILGAMAGFSLLYYCMVIAYPLNVAGQPLYGWPIFGPIIFECTVLFAATFGLVGWFLLNRLPQVHHPIFDAPGFDRVTTDRFFLCIEATDPCFGREETWRFLESLGALNVAEVRAEGQAET